MRLLPIIIMLILVGCGGKTAWYTVLPEHPRYAGNVGFSAKFPAGWLLFEDKKSRSVLLTRHSTAMDFIHLKRHRRGAALPYTKLTIRAGMQVYETAEIVINNLRATPGIYDLVTEEIAPAEIGGMEGFELLLSYTMDNGMRRRCLIYGVIVNGKYYAEAGLYALEDHYFDAALQDFLTLVESVGFKQ